MSVEHPTPDGLIASIKARPHWRVNFHPFVYDAQKLGSGREMLELVRDNEVALRGWNVPHTDRKGQTSTTRSYASSWTDAYGKQEYYRLYRSGQFLYLSTLQEDDERFQDELARFFPSYKEADSFLSIDIAVYFLTEIFEFVSRLQAQGIYASGMKMRIELNDVRGRGLSFSNSRRDLRDSYVAQESAVILEANYLGKQLLTGGDTLAMQAVRNLFEDFGANLSAEVIQSMQKELRDGR